MTRRTWMGAMTCLGAAKQVLAETRTAGVPDISPTERLSRIERAQRLMTEQGLHALFLEPGSSLQYFTGVSWGRSERMFAAVIPAKGSPAYVAPGFEETRARELVATGADVRVWQEDEDPARLVVDILRDRGLATGRLGMEETVRFFLFDRLRRAAPAIDLVDGTPVTAGCRTIKSPAELAIMKRANEIALEGVRKAAAGLHEGLAHDEFQRACEREIGLLGCPTEATITFGPKTALPHGSVEKQRLKRGDVVLIDAVCTLHGYQADITRSLVFGKPSDRQRKIWDLERKAQDAALAKVKPGVRCEEIDAAARKVITDAGFGPDYRLPGLPHRTGHGIGMDVHEWPYLVRGNRLPLAPGMCFSDEPMIVIPGEFGIRLEDCFHVTEEGGVTFTPQSRSIDHPFES